MACSMVRRNEDLCMFDYGDGLKVVFGLQGHNHSVVDPFNHPAGIALLAAFVMAKSLS